MKLNQKPFHDVKLMATNATAYKAQKCPSATPLWWVPLQLTVVKEGGSIVSEPITWLSPRKPYAEVDHPAADGQWFVANFSLKFD